MRVVIAGAGIAGLSVAHALVELGVRPTVVARDNGATASGAGIVSAQFWDGKLSPYARRSQEIIKALVATNRCGMAQIALTEGSALLLAQIESVGRNLPEALKSCLSPDFTKKIVSATFSQDDFWISNEELLKKLACGSDLISAEITGIADSSLQTSAGEIKADHLVLAMGPTCGQGTEKRVSMLGRLQSPIPAMLHVLDTGVYLRPDGDYSLAGDGDAPWTDTSTPPGVTDEFLASLAAEVTHLLGNKAQCTGVSAGVLAFTPDHRPIVHPQGNNWVMYGFGGDGLALAPAMGQEVARALVTGAAP